jgi:hypothetical protein
MFERFGFGSYRIDDSENNELASSKKSNLKLNTVLVHFLDGNSHKFEIEVSSGVEGRRLSAIKQSLDLLTTFLSPTEEG